MMRRLLSYVGLVAMLAASLLPAGILAQDAPEAPETPSVGDAAQLGGTLPGDPQVQLVQVASGLIDPVYVTGAGDGSGRLFVVERIGQIRIIENGKLLETPFLDIRNQVKDDFLEQGLLGLAFHPDYANNGKFYIFYSDYSGNGAQTLASYTVSADDPNTAEPTSQDILWQWPDPYINHNGGRLVFGPDGYLYLGVGDGGSAGDPFDQAQDLSKQFGKILRLDVDGAYPYAIPKDNPFADAGVILPGSKVEEAGRYHPDGMPEIFAYGLRNPWSFSFDSENGDLWIADVGQNWWEEINVLPAGTSGQNFGWDYLEATHCYPADVTSCTPWGTLPVAEYPHEDGSCSITGVGMHRAAESAALNGIYFAGDYCSGKIFGLAKDDAGTYQFAELLDTGLLFPGSGSDDDGNLYLTTCDCAYGKDYDPFTQSNGAVWMLVDANEVPEGAIVAPTDEDVAEASSTPSVAATPSASGEAQTSAEILSYDIYFEPKTVTIAANTDVTISLPNRGAIAHNFEISGQGIDVDIAAGASESVVVNLPPGEYTFICNVAGHEAAGMKGTLIVE